MFIPSRDLFISKNRSSFNSYQEEEKEEEEKKAEEVDTPIKQESPPPIVEATPVAEVTVSPGKPKASKKRKTRSRK